MALLTIDQLLKAFPESARKKLSGADLRTKEGRRNEILDQIEECGGFSIFWVTENHLRACVAEEMQESGEIITDNKTHGFPWIGARISKQNDKALAQPGRKETL